MLVVRAQGQGVRILVYRGLTSMVAPGLVGGLLTIQQCCGEAVALSVASVASECVGSRGLERCSGVVSSEWVLVCRRPVPAHSQRFLRFD